MSDEKSKPAENTHKHHYTCLAAPEPLQNFGLTHVVCREDMREQYVAAFNSSAAASNMCDQLNEFARLDDPSLMGEDLASEELARANALAAKSEKELSIGEKIKLAQQAAVVKS